MTGSVSQYSTDSLNYLRYSLSLSRASVVTYAAIATLTFSLRARYLWYTSQIPMHVIDREYEVCNLNTRTCQQSVKLFLRGNKGWLGLVLVLSPFAPLSVISTSPNFVVPHFWKLMSCLEQFPLRSGIPPCISPCRPQSKPRMGGLIIFALMLGSCLHNLRKDLQSLKLCQSM